MNVQRADDHGFCVHIGNLRKETSEAELRALLIECTGIVSCSFRLENCTYCPTKVAIVKFASRMEQLNACLLNQRWLNGKQLLVCCPEWQWVFSPTSSVMVKHLNEDISEEDLFVMFKAIAAVESVQKPTYNYAYIAFVNPAAVALALKIKRHVFKGANIEIHPIRRNISMLLNTSWKWQFQSIAEKCNALGLKYDQEAETRTILFVTNIPRQAYEEDVLQYLSKFGKIVEWKMAESPFSIMTNNGYVTYANADMARSAYLHGSHYFQGVVLEIYIPVLTYGEVISTVAVLSQQTSVYLTNDEIYNAMSYCGRVTYIHRMDSTMCTIVRFESQACAQKALKITQIAGESVSLTLYEKQNYKGADLVARLATSDLHLEKEAMLRMINEAERSCRLLTVGNHKYHNPQPNSYEVQVMNYDIRADLNKFRQFFKRCGFVTQFRQISVMAHGKVALLSFETKLEARRACSMNQMMMDGKRLLIFMACEKLDIDPDRCIDITGLSMEVTDEEIYERFRSHGDIRFVYRRTHRQALVYFEEPPFPGVETIGGGQSVQKPFAKHKNLVDFAIGIGKFSIQDSVSSTSVGPNVYASNNRPLRDLITKAKGIAANVDSISSSAQRGSEAPSYNTSSLHSMPTDSQVQGLISGTNGTVTGMLPKESEVNRYDPVISFRIQNPLKNMVASQQPTVTPAMQRLMQFVDKGMANVKQYTSLPKKDKYFLIHGIVNLLNSGKEFANMQPDEKINYLNDKQKGFDFATPFCQLTHGRQLQLLSLIETDFLENIINDNLSTEKTLTSSRKVPSKNRWSQPNETNEKAKSSGSLSVMDHFRLVNGIIKQFQEVPRLINMSDVDKISFLAAGFNGFEFANIFAKLSSAEQTDLLQNIKKDLCKDGGSSDRPSSSNANVQHTSSTVVMKQKPTNTILNTQLPYYSQPPQLQSKYTTLPAPIPPTPPMRPVFNSQMPYYSQPSNPVFMPMTLEPRPLVVIRPPACFRETTSNTYPSKTQFNTKFESKRPRNILDIVTSRVSYNRSLSNSPSPSRSRSRSSSRARYRSRSRSRNRSLSKSPIRFRRRSRSPRSRSRSRSPKPRRYNRSRSKERPNVPRANTPPRWSSFMEDEIASIEQAAVLVSNLPLNVEEEKLSEMFGTFGEIVTIRMESVTHGKFDKRMQAFIEFDTYNQAVGALDLHLTRYRRQIIRVCFANKRPKPQLELAISVSVRGVELEETSVLDTFKTCGDISNMWSKRARSITYYLVIFRQWKSIAPALRINSLINGKACEAVKLT
ncbi:uncharacterized protein LOC131676821 isoform X2 [Topomyia yanbarensis]|uniref:uncharacterized protein LOC131676821 isoform X2 n=1 Tax=Topomyia yanbarensis TaxID=2498891 RepID=UPI00273B6B3A|nr:uncharacterized protein LOC131676821 isoform X2 [Topomyia yanbarensis]